MLASDGVIRQEFANCTDVVIERLNQRNMDFQIAHLIYC